jgi:hypothetical protein
LSFVLVSQPIPIKPPREPSNVEPISSSVNVNQQPTSQTPTQLPWTLQMPSHSSSRHPTRTPRRSRRTLCSLLKKAPRKMVMPSRPARAHLLPEPSCSARSQKYRTISLQMPSHSLPDLQKFIISLPLLTKSHLLADGKSLAPLPSS